MKHQPARHRDPHLGVRTRFQVREPLLRSAARSVRSKPIGVAARFEDLGVAFPSGCNQRVGFLLRVVCHRARCFGVSAGYRADSAHRG